MKLIFEKSKPGRRAGRLPSYGLPPAEVPDELSRSKPPRLPEISEPELVRHFTALADRNFGVDTGFYPLGSCTMKHNPRVNERVVNLPGFRDLHPYQEEDAAQGALELMWRLQEILTEVCGLHAVSLATGGRLARRAHRPHADARVLRRPGRGGSSAGSSSPPTPRTARIPPASPWPASSCRRWRRTSAGTSTSTT